jgi:hypothetical protein
MSERRGILPVMRDRRVFRGLPLAGVAGAGVMVGHWLAYTAALPSGHLRAEVLAETGHGYWPLAVKAGLTVAIAAVAALVLRLAAGAPDEGRGRFGLFRSLAARLAAAQVLAFTVLEVSERLAVHAPLANLWQHHLFVLGLAIQLAVALAGALLLVALTRAVVRILEALLSIRARPVRTLAPRVGPPVLRHAVLAQPGVERAPPHS